MIECTMPNSSGPAMYIGRMNLYVETKPTHALDVFLEKFCTLTCISAMLQKA